ncbi:uncharacterized protein LOC124461673 [Drosophila willistoni]|uniref:uncharacterized protein LOC124461673 n=1 Tax=Drosophila willistoni TaxID=7260 RepID=UPI001F07FDA5|nr:uncharacterized protein LOC124461673 [Drosophila willistoni]
MPGVQDGENSDSRPVISVYDGSNYVGRLVVIEKGKETVSPVSSSLSVLEQSSDSSSESIEKCIKPQAQKRIINHDLPSENKRYKVDPTVSEESSENTSSGPCSMHAEWSHAILNLVLLVQMRKMISQWTKKQAMMHHSLIFSRKTGHLLLSSRRPPATTETSANY